MIRPLAVLPLLLLAETVIGQTFECRDRWRDAMEGEIAPVVVVASTHPNGQSGTIEVAGVSYGTDYFVDGFDRTWTFKRDDAQEWGYMFAIQPDGTGHYFDFELSDGEATRSSQVFKCRPRKLDSETAQEKELVSQKSDPDISALDGNTRQSIELACISDKVKGPAPYRKCVNAQLRSMEGAGPAPDFSTLDSSTRQSIELACISDKVKGPAPYRKCVNAQLQSIGIH